MKLSDTVDDNATDINYCESKDDMPKKMEKGDPFKKDQYQCIFCKHNIPIDYKNVQLLSQFVSPYTGFYLFFNFYLEKKSYDLIHYIGIIYSQQVTGLCLPKYEELQNNIIKARRLGLMPFFYKETSFQKDPHLFNPNYNSLKEIPNNYDQRKLNSDD
jgi:small subunit ribosomal protein S18